MKLFDIALALTNVHHLQDSNKIFNALNSVVSHIDITNERLLIGNGSNVNALILFYKIFSFYNLGSTRFWLKMESMVEKEVKNKLTLLDIKQLVTLADRLGF